MTKSKNLNPLLFEQTNPLGKRKIDKAPIKKRETSQKKISSLEKIISKGSLYLAKKVIVKAKIRG